ncbi:MAG: hypothetical protein JXC32_06615, partial [Anaerolineae bacterium]|nr:hypothetical protein [Anaerolineae bacterium]
NVSPAPLPTYDPWLSISDNQPKVGGAVMVSVHNHPADSYGVWWCPANAQAAQIKQQVATVTVPTGGDTSVTIFVPTGASGLYRLESHTTGGFCGNAVTYQCSSPLLAPKSGVFLPLVSRGH